MRRSWNAVLRNRRSTPSPRPRYRPRPCLEELEPRSLLAVSGGYSPAQLLQAYGFNQLGLAQPGLGQTIAIVGAYQNPSIQADLATFDARYGLPPVNLTVINDGATRIDRTGGWELETALDVEAAHAIAPYAQIILVEAANDFVNFAGVPTALLHAVSVAASQPGVDVVSMSWGVPEFRTEAQYDSVFATPGVTFVAASGDSGAQTSWPAVSPNVLSVGGTTLQISSSGTYLGETGWGSGWRSAWFGGSGGGISRYETEPGYQKGGYLSSVSTALNRSGKRMTPDVAYDGDPRTGLTVYDKTNGGWFVVGGTSAGAPQWAALVALADQLRTSASPALPSLSSAQTLTNLYQSQADFHDITTGNNGYAAGAGYDLVTGLGSPQANLLVPALARQGTATAVVKTAVATTPTTATKTATKTTTTTASNPTTAPRTGNTSNQRFNVVATLPSSGSLAASTALVSVTPDASLAQAVLSLSRSAVTPPAPSAPLPVPGSVSPVLPPSSPAAVSSSQTIFGGGDSGDPAAVLADDAVADPAAAQPMDKPVRAKPRQNPPAPMPADPPAVVPDDAGPEQAIDAVFRTGDHGLRTPWDPAPEAAPDRLAAVAGLLFALGFSQSRPPALSRAGRPSRNRSRWGEPGA